MSYPSDLTDAQWELLDPVLQGRADETPSMLVTDTHLTRQGVTDRLELVLVDRGLSRMD